MLAQQFGSHGEEPLNQVAAVPEAEVAINELV